MIRRAKEEDASRVAEILVFIKRMKFRPIFQDDAYSFGELQVLSVAKKYLESGILNHMLVYDDGIVKGLIRPLKVILSLKISKVYMLMQKKRMVMVQTRRLLRKIPNMFVCSLIF